MELSQIANKEEVTRNIEQITANLSQISADSELDMYNYFQGIKKLESSKDVTCPFCEKTFSPIESDIQPQKTMEDWEKESRSAENSMTPSQMRHYFSNNLKVELVNLVLSIRTFPRPIEQDVNSLAPAITALQAISKKLVDLNHGIEHAQTQQEVVILMKNTIKDIRKIILTAAQ